MVKNIKTLGIIPARFASTRFPGKPLAQIAGKTMIQRVFEQVSQAASLDGVVVATEDERIFEHVHSFGGKAVMTSALHLSGTDRCAEVAAMPDFSDFHLVANVQGDEPFIQPSQIDLAVNLLKKKMDAATPLSQQALCRIATLAKKIGHSDDLFQPNVVKVVFDRHHKALYFSRNPLPFLQNSPPDTWMRHGTFYKHIGLYVFERKTLLELADLPPGVLEQAESLEQLRWLENGYPVCIGLTEAETFGIDTPEDIDRYLQQTR